MAGLTETFLINPVKLLKVNPESRGELLIDLALQLGIFSSGIKTGLESVIVSAGENWPPGFKNWLLPSDDSRNSVNPVKFENTFLTK